MGAVVKYCKVPKYNDQDCLKIFLLLSSILMMIQISAKVLILFKKVSSVKNLSIGKVETLLKSNLWSKSNMQNSVYTKPLNLEPEHNWLVLYFYWRSEKWFEVIENTKKLELE